MTYTPATGSSPSGSKIDPAWAVLRQALRVLLVSNPDADHIGGFLDVLDAFSVERVYVSGDLKGTLTYNSFLRGVGEERSEVEAARAGRRLE